MKLLKLNPLSKKQQIETLEKELEIWQQAYPRCKKVLEKFVDKIMLELRLR